MSDMIQRALDEIDRFNRQDPNTDILDGQTLPREFAYSERLTRWVKKLVANPSDALLIAARGQHIGRWTIPRASYPMDRGGYLRWREALKIFHASKVEEILRSNGFDDAFIQRVRPVILKKDIKTNPETQTIEDALCLVFLETQYEELRKKTPEDKMITVVQKTWKKMGPAGQGEALKLKLTPEGLELIQKALK